MGVSTRHGQATLQTRAMLFSTLLAYSKILPAAERQHALRVLAQAVTADLSRLTSPVVLLSLSATRSTRLHPIEEASRAICGHRDLAVYAHVLFSTNLASSPIQGIVRDVAFIDPNSHRI